MLRGGRPRVREQRRIRKRSGELAVCGLSKADGGHISHCGAACGGSAPIAPQIRRRVTPSGDRDVSGVPSTGRDDAKPADDIVGAHPAVSLSDSTIAMVIVIMALLRGCRSRSMTPTHPTSSASCSTVRRGP